MIIRKMAAGEHGRTRDLWEAIFKEDTKEFLDYYYEYKVRYNQIYTVEDGERICAMLQLNPYKMHLRDRVVDTNYIIAVATDPQYRHKGLMRQLLTKSLRDMYQNREPFTFLMPAAKEIYLPFDFRYIYNQLQMPLTMSSEMKKRQTAPRLQYRMAGTDDASLLAQFSKRWLEAGYEVYTARDEAYYRTILKEQACQGGGIVMFYHESEMVGHVCYAYGAHLELRELIIKEEFKEELIPMISTAFPDEEQVFVIGLPNYEGCNNTIAKPMIMARIIHLEELAGCLRAVEPVSFELSVSDPIIEQNNGRFLWNIDEQGGRIEKIADEGEELRAAYVETTQISAELSIHQLTSLFFGYESIFSILEQGQLEFPSSLADKLAKIDCFHEIFINEVV